MLGFLSDNYYLSQCGTLLRKTINKNSENLIKSLCRCGGIGIRARLRGVWRNPWGFKSPHRQLKRG